VVEHRVRLRPRDDLAPDHDHDPTTHHDDGTDDHHAAAADHHDHSTDHHHGHDAAAHDHYAPTATAPGGR
jgi:hypothetical protein